MENKAAEQGLPVNPAHAHVDLAFWAGEGRPRDPRGTAVWLPRAVKLEEL